jgi:YD repeat-containing protein
MTFAACVFGTAPNKTLGTCRVGSTPSHTQYAQAFRAVAAMTAQFFSGLGTSENTFGSGSAVSQVMAQSPGVQDAINGYNIYGKTTLAGTDPGGDRPWRGQTLAGTDGNDPNEIVLVTKTDGGTSTRATSVCPAFSLVGTSVPQHVAAGQRGNLTMVNQSFSPPGFLMTASAYEDTGNPVSTTAPSGVSTYAYDPATHAFAITTTPPTPSSGVSLPSSATYDANSSLPLTAVDPNNQTATHKSYDPLYRPTEIDYPDGGKMTAGYTATQTGVFHYMTAGTQTNTQTNYDSYGRLNWVAVQNTPGGNYY